MKLKTCVFSLLCAAALVLGLVLPPALAAGESVYVLAVNDQFAKPLSTSNMPIFVNYTPYVPLAVFSDYSAELGIVVSSDSNKITLFNKQKALTYNLSAGTCEDQEGNTGYARAVSRGGVIYLPLSSIRDFFTTDVLNFYITIADASTTIIRLVTPSAMLKQAEFEDSALNSLPDLLRAYRNSQATPSPVPSPGLTPAPTPTPDKNGIRVYLAFDCAGGGELASILDTLARRGRSALFLFRVEDLQENDVLIRRMVGSGHTLGLVLPDGTELEDARALLDEGNRLLELIAHANTRIAYAPGNGGEALAAALEPAGWTFWRTDAAGGGNGLVSGVLAQVDRRTDLARVLLDDTEAVSSALPQLLRELSERNYSLRPALPTELNENR